MTSHHFSPQLEVRTSRHPVPVEPLQFHERYTVGVDLGQSNDYTAICAVRRLEETARKPVFQVGHLSRLPLGTPYPAVVSHITGLIAQPQIRGKAELVIDFTGVGRPVFDMFRTQGVSPIGVCITAGNAITNDGPIWHVPKGHLISRVQALLHEGRLRILAGLLEANTLVVELHNFRAEFTDSGYLKFNARSGAHDDLVLALAIALWRACGDDQHTGIISYYERLNRGEVAQVKAAPQKPRVLLKRIDSTSTVYTVTGRVLNVPENGVLEIEEDDAVSLLQAGWTRVEV